MTRWLLAMWLLVTVVVATGCGVPIEPEPRPIEPPRSPFPGLASGAPVEPGPASERLCLVRNGLLAAVSRSVPQQISTRQHLELLMQGPNDAERAAGYTSALPGTTDVRNLTQARGIVTIDIGERPAEAGRSDTVLAFGQIVCTLTTRPSVAAVQFTHNGQPLGVPRADGSLSRAPLTAADYATLLGPD